MKLNFKPKENITENFEISDFLNNFTVVHDTYYSLVYFISYQKFIDLSIKVKVKNTKNLPGEELFLNYEILLQNSEKHNKRRDFDANKKFQYFGAIGAVSFAFISVLILSFTGFVVVGLIFFVLAILSFVVFFFGSKNKKFFSNVTKFTEVKKMKNETMERIWVTPMMFENVEGSHIIKELNSVPNKINSINDIPRDKLKDYLEFLTLDEKILEEENITKTKKIVV